SRAREFRLSRIRRSGTRGPGRHRLVRAGRPDPHRRSDRRFRLSAVQGSGLRRAHGLPPGRPGTPRVAVPRVGRRGSSRGAALRRGSGGQRGRGWRCLRVHDQWRQGTGPRRGAGPGTTSEGEMMKRIAIGWGPPTWVLSACALATLAVPAAGQSPEAVAEAALAAAPVWDGHNDAPIQLRSRFGNMINDFDFADTTGTDATSEDGGAMHTDLARLAKGRVGAQFWSVYVSAELAEPDAVVATVEQIDVTKRLIARYPDRLALALSAADVERALAEGRIASLIGMEGGHSIASS